MNDTTHHRTRLTSLEVLKGLNYSGLLDKSYVAYRQIEMRDEMIAKLEIQIRELAQNKLQKATSGGSFDNQCIDIFNSLNVVKVRHLLFEDGVATLQIEFDATGTQNEASPPVAQSQ